MASEIEEVAGPVFPQFDMMTLTDSRDHCFTECNRGNYKKGPRRFLNADSNVYKRIMQEWKILRKNLPKTIYVRACESRIDQLRAVIIGARGTPYHDGLFFFDIAFPPDYPTGPPKICYLSYGLSINPNLYEDGHVCLSLLNTWLGSKCERWDPSRSTILQVLVSIQGLVLNQEPIYNEPLAWRGWSSTWYNKKVFALSCKTMQLTLRKPPSGFAPFVLTHFRQRACFILQAIEDYRNGSVSVGHFNGNRLYTSSQRVSKMFQKELDHLYRRLFKDFYKIKAQGLDNMRPSLPAPTPKATCSMEKEACTCHCMIISILRKIFNMRDDA